MQNLLERSTGTKMNDYYFFFCFIRGRKVDIWKWLTLAGDCLWYFLRTYIIPFSLLNLSSFFGTLSFFCVFQIIIEDLRENFIDDYVWPSIRGGLIYEDRYLLGTSLARPCIASGLVRAAIRENANFISHGATGKGNDQVRFELACYSLHPTVQALQLSLFFLPFPMSSCSHDQLTFLIWKNDNGIYYLTIHGLFRLSHLGASPNFSHDLPAGRLFLNLLLPTISHYQLLRKIHGAVMQT
jgi:hypothetical protein